MDAHWFDGSTPLTSAIMECPADIQDVPIMLINLGADVRKPGPKGVAPIDLAREKELDRVVTLINSKLRS